MYTLVLVLPLLACFIGPGATQELDIDGDGLSDGTDLKPFLKCNIGEGHLPFTDAYQCLGPELDAEACGESFTCVNLNPDLGLCCPVGQGPCHQSLQHANLHDGTFVPKCNPDGSYAVWQCFNEWHCYCTTLDGIQLGPNSIDWSFPNLHNQAMCEDLAAIYKHLCEDESKLAKLLKRLMSLYTTAKSRWQKKHPAPDPTGREELNELWNLILCVRKLLLRVEELKKKIDSGDNISFGSIEKELSSILKKMAQKVDAMFDLIDAMKELGFRDRDTESLADDGESFDDIQDELIEALLDVAERALEEIKQATPPVPNLPENVTDICKGIDGLLNNCLDLLINYQAIRKKLKKLTDKDTYPYGEMSDLFTCISNFCDWVKKLHNYLGRIKRGELDPKDDHVLTELGELISNLQKASAKLLDYRQKLLHEIRELGLENKFEKLFETDENGLNAHLEEMEQLVDAITEAFNDLFLDSLED